MSNVQTSPQAKNNTTLNLKNLFSRSADKVIAKSETSTTTQTNSNSSQINTGRSKTFSNRTSPEIDSNAKSQSKEITNNKSNIDEEISSKNNSPDSQNGRERGSDVTLPGCSGGCGCNCGK